MRNSAIRNTFLAVVIAVGLFGCQSGTAVEYVKYESEANVPRISAEDAKKDFDAGNAVFVDTRGDAAWKVERLPGALSMMANATDDQFSVLPKGKKIIAYCT